MVRRARLPVAGLLRSDTRIWPLSNSTEFKLTIMSKPKSSAIEDHGSTVSIPGREVLQVRVIWEGLVEVFIITGHPKAKRCYAWSHKAGKDDQDARFVAVLEIPSVISAESAVKVAIAAKVKGNKL
jgi:hypothetical protein